jgi:hypothetical protein
MKPSPSLRVLPVNVWPHIAALRRDTGPESMQRVKGANDEEGT